MAQHNVKIDDSLYAKLKAYCDLNHETVYKICNDAIREYLNKIQYGDAPFMIESVAIKADTLDKNGRVYTEKALTDALKEYKDENGHFVVTHMPAEDGEKMLVKLLSENQDPGVTQEQAQKVDEMIKESNYIVGIDTASEPDYTATVEGTIDKEGNFEVKKTTVERPRKRRL